MSDIDLMSGDVVTAAAPISIVFSFFLKQTEINLRSEDISRLANTLKSYGDVRIMHKKKEDRPVSILRTYVHVILRFK